MSNNYKLTGLSFILTCLTIGIVAYIMYATHAFSAYVENGGENCMVFAFERLQLLYIPALMSVFCTANWSTGWRRAVSVGLCFLYPLVLWLSYWCWELLGWGVLLIAFGVVWYLNDDLLEENEDAYCSRRLKWYIGKRPKIISALCCGYFVLRILLFFIYEDARVYIDIVFLTAMPVVYVVDSLILWLENQVYTTWAGATVTNGIPNGLYALLLAVLMLAVTAVGTPFLPKPEAAETTTEEVMEVAVQEPAKQKTTAAKTSKQTTASHKQGQKQKQTTATTEQKQSNKSGEATVTKSTTATNKSDAAQPTTTPAKTQEPAQPAKPHPFAGYKTAADAGDATAMYNTAKCYQQGDGVAKDLSQAFRYMKASAEGGYTKAYRELAEMYRGGRGTAKNRDLAEDWYRKAAAAGDRKAQQALDNM